MQAPVAAGQGSCIRSIRGVVVGEVRVHHQVPPTTPDPGLEASELQNALRATLVAEFASRGERIPPPVPAQGHHRLLRVRIRQCVPNRRWKPLPGIVEQRLFPGRPDCLARGGLGNGFRSPAGRDQGAPCSQENGAPPLCLPPRGCPRGSAARRMGTKSWPEGLRGTGQTHDSNLGVKPERSRGIRAPPASVREGLTCPAVSGGESRRCPGVRLIDEIRGGGGESSTGSGTFQRTSPESCALRPSLTHKHETPGALWAPGVSSGDTRT